MRRLSSLLLVIVLAIVVAAPIDARRPAAQPADDSKIAVVREAYALLLDLFYDPLDPATLLREAWAGLAATLTLANRPGPLPPLPAGREEAFTAFEPVYRAYVADLPGGMTPLEAAFALTNAMARAAGDPGHTFFLTPAQYRARIAQSSASELPQGLGISSRAGPPRLVTRVAPNGPAERAGVRPGDIIVAANGRDITMATPVQAAEALAGPPGSTAVLSIDRLGERLEIAVPRGPFYFPALTARLLPDGVGYIKLDQFVQNVAPLPDESRIFEEFDRRLDELEAQGARGLVIDLRDNPGGYVSTNRTLMGRFLPEDTPSVIARNFRRPDLIDLVGGEMRRTQLPIVLLVNGGSASASETMASTLRENDRVLLVGQRTRGSLSRATLLPLPEGAGIQISGSEILTAKNGVKVNEVGIPVDIEVADTRTPEDFARDRDPQRDAAVAALAMAPRPPVVRSMGTGVTEAELRARFAGFVPDPTSMPTNTRLTAANFGGSGTVTHVNNAFGGAPDPLARQAELRANGFLGSYYQLYSVDLLVPPIISVGFDLFATTAGASRELTTNSAPWSSDVIPNRIDLGEETITTRGINASVGNIAIAWRYGPVVISVGYDDVPGLEDWDALTAAARQVDARYRQNPLPPPKKAMAE